MCLIQITLMAFCYLITFQLWLILIRHSLDCERCGVFESSMRLHYFVCSVWRLTFSPLSVVLITVNADAVSDSACWRRTKVRWEPSTDRKSAPLVIHHGCDRCWPRRPNAESDNASSLTTTFHFVRSHTPPSSVMTVVPPSRVPRHR